MSTQTDLFTLKGIISEMTPEERDKITKATDALRSLAKEHGEAFMIALSIVGMETALAAEKGKA